jgi:hypothetical protein
MTAEAVISLDVTCTGKSRRIVQRTWQHLHIPHINYSTFQTIRTSIMSCLQIIGSDQLEICFRRGIHFVGSTVQQNRRGIPFSFKTKHAHQRQQHVRGEYTTVKAGFYLSNEINDDIYCTAWLDRKPVSIHHMIPIRMVKTNNDGWQRQEYVRPTIIPIYNHGMGGTDSGDQRMETYRPELKRFLEC